MKKVFAILFVAGMAALASCTSKDASNVDSTIAATSDSVATVLDSAATATVDSIASKVDSVAK